MTAHHATKYTGNFDEELISALPASLKYICHNGAGYDNIDIPACTKRGAWRQGSFFEGHGFAYLSTMRLVGILVSSTPVAVNHATADVGMFLMLGALRQAYVPLAAIRAGSFPPSMR
jgi:glyoxylate reductase